MAATDKLSILAERALGLVRPGERTLVAVTGSPGAGKTTLADGLAARVNALAVARGWAPTFAASLPMDGYHLANRTLDRLAIHDRKGAIETFDGWGFVSLLRRLLEERDHVVYAPGFERTIDEGVTGFTAIEPETELVFIEGNYLLVDTEPWAQIKGLVAEAWFVAADSDERERRLVDRHQEGGRTPEAALAWAQTVDGKNAILIESTRPRADLIISGTDSSILSAPSSVSTPAT